jgi:ribosomal-protein-alanine N-acetyltransferase
VIDVRPAAGADAAWLAAIHAQAFDDPWPAADIAVLMGGPGVYALAAHIDDAAMAFILCRTVADEAEILTLATVPAGRRRGAASRLIDAAATAASSRAATTMFLEVAEDNLAALALYRGEGFTEVGRRRDYYRRPSGAVAAVVMRRDLNN